jgi:hypothetical protein
MDKLDRLVTGQLIDRLLAPERLSEILFAFAVNTTSLPIVFK